MDIYAIKMFESSSIVLFGITMQRHGRGPRPYPVFKSPLFAFGHYIRIVQPCANDSERGIRTAALGILLLHGSISGGVRLLSI